MTKRRGRRLSIIGSILIVAGLGALGWCGFYLVRAHLYQEKSVAVLNAKIAKQPAPEHRPPVTLVPAKMLRLGALIGELNIPGLKISSVILEGDDAHTLALSVGHIPGTALPGYGGNVALAGHRDTFFRGLARIRKDDKIVLTTPRGERIYTVDSMRVVSPRDTSVLAGSSQPLLTLVTCYPFHYIGPAPKRFIVRARLVGG